MKSLAAALSLASVLSVHCAVAAPGDNAAVQTALAALDPEIKPEHYDIARADLDGDGTDDVFALMNGKSGYCGSGGCTLFVLRSVKNNLVKVGAIRVVSRPILIRKSTHHGLRDLLVRVQGGGATPGDAVLEFDGTGYPVSPGEPVAKPDQDDKVLFAETPAPFSKTEKLQGITWQIASPNTIPANTVTIQPSGLEKDNSPVTAETKYIVTGAEVADINSDGSPEAYVYLLQPGPEKRGAFLAWSANKKKSFSAITIPELPAGAKELRGYRGGDEFAVVEGILARRFPIYPDDNAAARPTGKMRQLQYKLVAGEAAWTLKLDKVVEF